MRESDLVELRVLPRVFPQHPYARHTAGLGARGRATLPHVLGKSGVLNVKVIGIYCSRRAAGDCATQREEGVEGINKKFKKENGEEAVLPNEILGNRGGECEGTNCKRHIYVRVQFNKVLVDTVPLEVIREKYPQVLIDYLLSTAVWT
ncbi:hypothetical protein TcG_01757 [Trypanosoma cruzi]|nr:hypothetical protein TcBrA4_0077450 [Trypanosoma cruzi]PBJ72355.1 hypothetical protein BCY84_15947 [Trypanosoma cruzi cruzi]RNF23200.1 hypothetical protein TcG_01757 [Trypanosoma cruzi]